MLHQEYTETLNYLFRQLPMFQRVGPKAFKKDLSNTIALVKILGQPQDNFPSIHIAGTNGKGSTAHLLSAVLQAKGLKTGLYTSPHYSDFRERIKINGKYIPKRVVIDFVQNYKRAYAEIKPSFFEITVALAFHYFAQEKVDVAVIETGLGGRLDSTNILKPLLSIITNISLDHQNFLGNTLPLIACEKAGIIKMNTPVVIGESHAETKSVFLDKAKAQNAPIYFADQVYQANIKSDDLHHSYLEIKKNGEVIHPKLKVNLHGAFQEKNIQTLFQSIDLLKEQYPIENKDISAGLGNLKSLTNFKGRWQILNEKPLTICDSAHNIEGIKLVMGQIKKLKYQKLHFVLGTVNDKDLGNVLALLPKTAKYYFAKANIPRGLDAKQLQTQALQHGLKGKSYSSIKNALRAAKRAAEVEDLIYIGGSTFTVAEII